jgi:hypothetical protein
LLKNDQEIPGNSSKVERKQIIPSLFSANLINCTPTELDICMIPLNIMLRITLVNIVTGLLDGD